MRGNSLSYPRKRRKKTSAGTSTAFSIASLIDSSVWIALFLNFDTQHTKATRLFSEVQGALWAPYCVVLEVATVLAYKHSKQQADAFLTYLESNRDVVLLDDIVRDEIAFYKSLSRHISFTDAALILLSKNLKTRLVTFDKELKRIARSMGIDVG